MLATRRLRRCCGGCSCKDGGHAPAATAGERSWQPDGSRNNCEGQEHTTTCTSADVCQNPAALPVQAALESAGEGLLADYLRACVYSCRYALAARPLGSGGDSNQELAVAAGARGWQNAAMRATGALSGCSATLGGPAGSAAQPCGCGDTAFWAAGLSSAPIAIPHVFRTKVVRSAPSSRPAAAVCHTSRAEEGSPAAATAVERYAALLAAMPGSSGLSASCGVGVDGEGSAHSSNGCPAAESEAAEQQPQGAVAARALGALPAERRAVAACGGAGNAAEPGQRPARQQSGALESALLLCTAGL